MKFSCEKTLLQTAISITSRTIATKSSIPALEGILLEANTNLRLTGYNLETGIRTTLPADIEDPGTIILSARIFGDIIRKLPDDIVTIIIKDHMVNIKCGMSEFNILGIDAEEFPELPTVEQQNSFQIQQQKLKAMISQTSFAISTNESRPIHTGSLFEVDQQGLTIISVDGFRLALRHEPIEDTQNDKTFSFVVPGTALNEIEKICSDTEETVSITQGTRHILFQVGNTILISRRLEGEFLAYRKAIPRNNNIHIEADTKQLLTSIERVSLIISEKLKSPLHCTFDRDLLHIKTKTAIGDAADQCPLEGNGNGLEIGFNNKYMIDALKAVPADHIRIELSSSVSPCIILPTENEDPEPFLYMVLPVRLKTGD